MDIVATLEAAQERAQTLVNERDNARNAAISFACGSMHVRDALEDVRAIAQQAMDASGSRAGDTVARIFERADVALRI